MTSATGISLFWGASTTTVAIGTLNNPDSLPSPVGDKKTMGFAFNRGDVPAGFMVVPSVTVAGITSPIPTYSTGARVYNADGSLGWLEMKFRVPVAIPANGQATITCVKQAGAFNDALPNGMTKAQVIAAIAADPTLAHKAQIANIQSCTGLAPPPDTIGSGTWASDMNYALSHEILNYDMAGPCAATLTTFGPYRDAVTGIAHDSLRIYWHVTAWFDTNGNVEDLEVVASTYNGELLAAHPVIDRYTYEFTLTVGGRVVQDQAPLPKAIIPSVTGITVANGVATAHCDVPHGMAVNQNFVIYNSPDPAWNNGLVYGGFNAVAAVPDPLSFTFPAPNTTPPATFFFASSGGHHARSGWHTLDSKGRTRFANSATSKLFTSMGKVGRDMRVNSGHMLPLDQSAIPGAPIDGVGAVYSPLTKAGVDGVSTAYDFVGVDGGGDHSWIGLITEQLAVAAFCETEGAYNDARVSAACFASFNVQWIDKTGRAPNLLTGSYPGMGTAQPDTYRLSNNRSDQYNGITPNSQNNWVEDGCFGGTDGDTSIRETTHWWSLIAITYQIEGGAHLRHSMMLDATFTLMQCPLSQRNPTTPVTTNGVYLGGYIEREDAWGAKALQFASMFTPDLQADGTPVGEKAYWRDVHTNTFKWSAAFIQTMSPAAKTLGIWNNQGTSGTDDPWMFDYLVQWAAWIYKVYGNSPEPFAANLDTFIRHIKKYPVGFWTINKMPGWMKTGYTLELKIDSNTFVDDWTQVASHGDNMFPSFADGATGWFYPMHNFSYPIIVNSITVNGTTATAETAAPHGLVATQQTTLMGVAPDACNGNINATNIVDATHFQFELAAPLPGLLKPSLTSMAICNSQRGFGQYIDLIAWEIGGNFGPFVGDRQRIVFDWFNTFTPALPPDLPMNKDMWVIAVDRKNQRVQLSATKGGPPITFSRDLRDGAGYFMGLMDSTQNPSRGYVGYNNPGSYLRTHQAAVRLLRWCGLDDADLQKADQIISDTAANTPWSPCGMKTTFEVPNV